MKYVTFGAKDKPVDSRTVSVYEAHRIKEQLSALNEPCDAGEYEFYRDDTCVIYNENKRRRTAQGIVKRRAAAYLAKGCGDVVELDGEGVRLPDGYGWYFADRVSDGAELEFHNARAEELGYDGVLVLRKSRYAPYMHIDNKAIRSYYDKFTFPDWFKPFVGMRHFRFMLNDIRFKFQTRRYNDTSKHSADSKIRHDMRQAYCGISKVYFSLFRCLDSKLEKRGQGHMIDLGMLTFDLDVSHEGPHIIDSRGLCSTCLSLMEERWEALQSRLYELKQPVEKVVFSGTKGLHVHTLREVSEAEFVDILTDVNEGEELVDDFTYLDGNVTRFDRHRIFKVPWSVDSTTACIVDENWKNPTRIDVADRIIIPSA
mgnify:CR=1 FL=1